MSTTNLSIYIKRAEINQTKEYIINALHNYGVVDDLEFIDKTNDNGQKYHGVIVHFKQWHFNNIVEELWNQLHANKEATCKIFHGHRNSKFWIVSVHKVESNKQEIVLSNTEIDLTNLDSNTVNIINDLQLKIKLLESQLQKKEIFCMQNEHERMCISMKSYGIESELQDKDIQIYWLNDEKKEIQEKNSMLIKKNTKLMNENLDLKLNIKILKEQYNIP